MTHNSFLATAAERLLPAFMNYRSGTGFAVLGIWIVVLGLSATYTAGTLDRLVARHGWQTITPHPDGRYLIYTDLVGRRFVVGQGTVADRSRFEQLHFIMFKGRVWSRGFEEMMSLDAAVRAGSWGAILAAALFLPGALVAGLGTPLPRTSLIARIGVSSFATCVAIAAAYYVMYPRERLGVLLTKYSPWSVILPAAFVFLAASLVHAAVRWYMQRRFRGRCAQCGYPSISATCPECGTSVQDGSALDRRTRRCSLAIVGLLLMLVCVGRKLAVSQWMRAPSAFAAYAERWAALSPMSTPRGVALPQEGP